MRSSPASGSSTSRTGHVDSRGCALLCDQAVAWVRSLTRRRTIIGSSKSAWASPATAQACRHPSRDCPAPPAWVRPVRGRSAPRSGVPRDRSGPPAGAAPHGLRRILPAVRTGILRCTAPDAQWIFTAAARGRLARDRGGVASSRTRWVRRAMRAGGDCCERVAGPRRGATATRVGATALVGSEGDGTIDRGERRR